MYLTDRCCIPIEKEIDEITDRFAAMAPVGHNSQSVSSPSIVMPDILLLPAQ